MITGNVVLAPEGTRGFDCNRPLTTDEAKKFFDIGYRFAVRYVGREKYRSNDLSAKEVEACFHGGLAVMAVQHVESEDGWIPSAIKGLNYGSFAASECSRIGLAAGTMCWLDLEGVDQHTPDEIIITYCNNWWATVGRGGYTPGIYVGWHAGLNAQQLYSRLKFEHYWSAYNLNADQMPAVRGVQMKQGSAKRSADIPAGLNIEIDTDLVQADKLGGLPLVYAPEEWAVG